MEERTYCVYMHTNKVNGKKYIGQTKMKPEERWGSKGHRYRECTHFFNAIKKWGFDNFEHEIVYSGLSHIEANEKEQELIELYNTRNLKYGYNLREGGSNGGLSEESKRKLSELRKGKYTGSNSPNYGKKLSDETKLKISMAQRGEKSHCFGKVVTKEVRQKIAESHIGKKHTEKTKEKISLSKKGKQCGKDNPNYGNHKLAGNNNPRCKIVLQYDNQGNCIREWEYIKLASQTLKIHDTGIIQCCKGKRQTAGGFVWKYKE